MISSSSSSSSSSTDLTIVKSSNVTPSFLSSSSSTSRSSSSSSSLLSCSRQTVGSKILKQRSTVGQMSKNIKKTKVVMLDDDESHALILRTTTNTNGGRDDVARRSAFAGPKSNKINVKRTLNSGSENRAAVGTAGTAAASGGGSRRCDDDDVTDLSRHLEKKLTLTADETMDDVNEATGELIPVDWQKEHKQMDSMFESQIAKQLDGLPPFQRPPGLKESVIFFDHQTDGVSWLLKQEVDAPPNPFNKHRRLKDGTLATYDYLTRRRIYRPHPPVKGSILSDDMGLGKTLQTLTLILSNPPKHCRYGPAGQGRRPSMTFDGETTICTVIVCPKSVISNWISQARDFVERDYLNIVVYEGTPANRSDIIRKVQQNKVDLLLSTYETIAAEHNKERLDKSGRPLKGIHDIKFHRIVLDEAQQIRNHKSKTYIAIDSVAQNSVYRLAISGTPFVNKPEDVMSLLSFIGLQPLGDPAAFKEYVSDPIKERRRAGLTRLRLACAYVVLRRTKGIVSTGMADKTIHVHSIDFPNDSIHKQIYEALYCACRVAMSASLRHSSITVSASTHRAMFAMLMRVRQSCASGSLVQAAHYEVALHLMKSMYDEDGNVKELSQWEGNRMLDILQNAKSADGSRVDVKGVPSPKISALMNTISQMQPDEKGVIFSQWTSMLDLIGNALASAGHRFTRIDGSMSTTERTCALNSLKNDDECRFILCSLKAAGVGINLTRANVCFMMDPWWNDAIESQAIDRVHRVGQTRPVRVYRMVMKNSIEERMMKVQKAKSTLGKGTLTKLTKEEEKIAKLTGMKDLFEIDDIRSHGKTSISDDWLDH